MYMICKVCFKYDFPVKIILLLHCSMILTPTVNKIIGQKKKQTNQLKSIDIIKRNRFLFNTVYYVH